MNPDRAGHTGHLRSAPGNEQLERADVMWGAVVDTLAGDDDRTRRLLRTAGAAVDTADRAQVGAELRHLLGTMRHLDADRCEQFISGYVVLKRDPRPGCQLLRSAVVGILREPAVQQRMTARVLNHHRAYLIRHGHTPTSSTTPTRSRRRR
ncbi:MAG: hypothetical protein Q7T56_08780 [Nocardioidaceae bacterium]|nr:hypothetical protein [Nocardioidaceae bacterium]